MGGSYLCKTKIFKYCIKFHVYESHKKRKVFSLTFDCGCNAPVNFFLACSVFEILKDKWHQLFVILFYN